MAIGRPTPVRDAIISAVAAMAIGGISLILYAYEVYWLLSLIALGVVVFLIVLIHSRFYRLVVWSCIGLLSAVLSIPAIRFTGAFADKAAVKFVIDSVGTGGVVALSMLCCVALCVSAWMDRIGQRTEHKREDAEDEDASVLSQMPEQRIESPNHSVVIGRVETLHMTCPQAESPVDREPPHPAEGKTICSWPGTSLPHGGPKISEPFAGREDELKELDAAMSGHKKIGAVVGIAGQGKSCLIGEWYKRGARPPAGIGLFWRKVYESGYTFDRFLDDLHLYLAGEPIDRTQVKTIRERTSVVENFLAAKPCWIALDGVERWFRRWASDPDAEARNATPDDRAGQEPSLDEFLKGAHFWEGGARLLLTTRAVPSALDENLPVMIGDRHGTERHLEDLKPDEAIRLLDELAVNGDEKVKCEAVSAYGCHAYAVHVLGVLIRDLYAGDISHWREVNPLREPKLDGLLQRIVETYKDDLVLLELVACSLAPVPVEMLAALISRDGMGVRKSLCALGKWQIVEFDGRHAKQHTIVRRFLREHISCDTRLARLRQIAAWWAYQMVPVNPKTIQDISPQLHAIEHLVAARDIRTATTMFFTQAPGSHYNIDDWLRAFGYLDDETRITASMIETSLDLIQNEGHSELCDDLASCYNSRGNARRAQGHLSEAIADYDLAVEITIRLVEKEGRRELRGDLARRYSNRGVVLGVQGFHSRAIADYGHAIEIATILVEREGDNQLRSDLAGFYCNRGITWAAQGRLVDAIADYGQAIEIVKNLVGREGRHDLRKDLAVFCNNRGLALVAQGRLSEAIVDYGSAVEITEELIERDGRSEYRDLLATCQNNRGLAFAHQGRLREAIADHARAINVYETLVQREGRRELRDGLAAFYCSRGSALKDQGRLQEAIIDYNLAVQIQEELVEREDQHQLRSALAISYNNRGAALATQGRLKEAIADYGRAIEIREELVSHEGRHDVRADLAISYIGRGLTLRQQKHLARAIADCTRAIEIERTLVEKEGRCELRNDLAKGYTGRGLAWAARGCLQEAIADYDFAIEIQEALVEQERRGELVFDLACSLFNRAAVRSETREWQRANADVGKGVCLLHRLLQNEQRHILPSLLRAADFRCRYAKELGDPAGAIQGANEAMQRFLEEVEQNRTTEPLLKATAEFAECVRGNRRFLFKHGLDEALWKKVQESVKC